MRSMYAASLLVLGANAIKLNPMDPSPNYTDWFEHPSYMDAHYADYYTRDLSNAVNAAEIAGVDYLVNDPKQYWVENWYNNSAMPIHPQVAWDQDDNLPEDVKIWRNNKWVDDSVTATNEQKQLLETKYSNLLKKLGKIELDNVEQPEWKYAAKAQELNLLLKTLEELSKLDKSKKK